MDSIKRVLITGAAGFLGSNLCDYYLGRGNLVVGVDNFSTGRKQNLKDAMSHPNFIFIEHDITNPLPKKLSAVNPQLIFNLACPASPPQYQRLAKETMEVSSAGLKNVIALALKRRARLVHASTSEVYGDPKQHPQKESYWGFVNPYGPRAMYDEGKRFAEALLWICQRQNKLNGGIARIFNTYGVKMDPKDGRVVSNFIVQALKGDELTIYGDGKQTRSFCYVDDLVEGLAKLGRRDIQEPINLGNPDEFTIEELAQKILRLTGSNSKIKHLAGMPDDPSKRQPDISKARKLLAFKPKISLEEGLKRTIAYFKEIV